MFSLEFYFVLLVLILEKKKVVKSLILKLNIYFSYRSFGVILRHFKCFVIFFSIFKCNFLVSS